MPVTISVTKRVIHNKTGIDAAVTSYGPKGPPKNVKDYHVVVITRLPFFKLPEHSDEDTVQFMVARDFSAFEKLQKDILVGFPELKLPNLPRKFLMFVDVADIEERMVSFDCIMRIISRSKEMCTSPPMLEFLGFSLTADKKYFKARRELLQKKDEVAEDKKKYSQKVYGDCPNDSDQGFFGGGSTDEPFSDDSHNTARPYTGDSIFEEEEESKVSKKKKRSAKMAVMEDDDDDIDLFGVKKESESESKGRTEPSAYGEDNSELLDVSDTLDDVLKLVKDDKKKGAKKVMAETKKKGGSGLFDLGNDSVGGGSANAMGEDDIMKYIQQNQPSNADDDLDFL